jgi:hypothetical protein
MRSAELTRDPARRASRALAGAEAALQAGAISLAHKLVRQAEPDIADQRTRALARRVDGELHVQRGQYGIAPSILHDAALELEPFDPAAARDTLLEAMEAARVALQLASPTTLRAVADTALHRSRHDAEVNIADALLDAYATDAAVGFVEAAPMFRRVLTTLCEEDIEAEEIVRWAVLGLWTGRTPARRRGLAHVARAGDETCPRARRTPGAPAVAARAGAGRDARGPIRGRGCAVRPGLRDHDRDGRRRVGTEA